MASRKQKRVVVDITKEAYGPATVEDLNRGIKERKEGLQKMYKAFQKAKLDLRAAIDAYDRDAEPAEKKAALATIHQKTEEIKTIYNNYSEENPFNTEQKVVHQVGFEDIQGYLYRELSFEHHRTGKIPPHKFGDSLVGTVGTLTYPIAYPSEWFFKPKVSAPAAVATAELGAEVGPGGSKKGGGMENGPKKQLSGRQIGAIIAARRAGRF